MKLRQIIVLFLCWLVAAPALPSQQLGLATALPTRVKAVGFDGAEVVESRAGATMAPRGTGAMFIDLARDAGTVTASRVFQESAVEQCRDRAETFIQQCMAEAADEEHVRTCQKTYRSEMARCDIMEETEEMADKVVENMGRSLRSNSTSSDSDQAWAAYMVILVGVVGGYFLACALDSEGCGDASE